MDTMWTELVVAIITAVLGFVFGKLKEKQDCISAEDKYAKYALILEVSGKLVQAMDEQLYNEMVDCVTKLKTAYESPTFTTAMFKELVAEAKDVFDRAEALLKNRG